MCTRVDQAVFLAVSSGAVKMWATVGEWWDFSWGVSGWRGVNGWNFFGEVQSCPRTCSGVRPVRLAIKQFANHPKET